MEVQTKCSRCSILKSQQQNESNQRCILIAVVTGGSFPFTIGRIEHGHRVRPDLCAVDNTISPRKYLGSFYTDSLVHDPIALKLLIEIIGKVSLRTLFTLTMTYWWSYIKMNPRGHCLGFYTLTNRHSNSSDTPFSWFVEAL